MVWDLQGEQGPCPRGCPGDRSTFSSPAPRPPVPHAAAPHHTDMPSWKRACWDTQMGCNGRGTRLSIRGFRNSHARPVLRFPQPRKSQPGFNTPKSHSSAWEPHPAVFQPSSPSIAALPPAPGTGAGTGGRSPSRVTPSARDRDIPSGSSFTSPTACCWQVVLPGNLRWGEEGNAQPAAPATLQTGVGVPPNAPSAAAQPLLAQLLAWGPADASAACSCPTMATALMVSGLSALHSIVSGPGIFLPRLSGSCRTSPH